MAASAAPLPPAAADPLAGLNSYYRQFLPTHLARAGRAADLFQLLLLRRGDDSNAWYTAKPDVGAYLADVARGSALAVEQADCAKVISFGLIADSVRSTTQLPGPVIESLVNRGLLSLQEAVSICTAAEPSHHVSGMARLLPRISNPERGRYLQAILTTMSVPRARRVIGKGRNDMEFPLSTEEHVAVIPRLAALLDLTPAELAAIGKAAWLVGTTFAGIESSVAVAGKLVGGQRVEALSTAWSAATGLDLFRGRPEAQALVAACAARGGDEQYLTDACQLAVSVLDSSNERLQFNDWSPHGGDPGFGRSRLMRFQSYTEPLKTLAPVLGPERITDVVCELAGREDVAPRFGMIALLPRLAELGLVQEADSLFRQLSDTAVMACGALFEAGYGLGQLHAEDFLDSVTSMPDAEPRTMCLLALLPGLPPQRRLSVIETLLRGVENLGERSSFRTDVLKRLSSVIRQLPGPLRDGLIRQAHELGELIRSAEEVTALLEPVVDVWPVELLQDRLATVRRIGLRASEITRAHRAIGRAAPDRPEPGLDPTLAAAALAFVAELHDADKAAALVLLAPFLTAAGCRQARDASDGITAAHLRLEPAVRLAALEPQADPEQLTAIIRLLGQVTAGLERVQASIDVLASLITPGHAGELGPVLAEVAQELPREDLTVLCPVGAAMSGRAYYQELDQAIAGLAVWFGVEGSAAPGPAPDLAPLVLDTSAAGARLIGEFCRRGDWTAVRSLLAVLRAAQDGNDQAIAAAESQIISSQANGPAVERLALLADLVQTAPDRPRRLRALAAALRAARALPQSEQAALLLQSPDLTPGLARESDLDLAAAIAAAIDLELDRRDLQAAAGALKLLVTGGTPYHVALGRLAAQAADSLARYLDGQDGPEAPVGNDAIDAYLDFLAAHPEDYALQEAGGGLLRRRVATAAAADREVRQSWLSRLDALADADDPSEVLLHQLALEATCDAAGAAARAGQAERAAGLFRLAASRWQRHREVTAYAQYLADAARAAVSALQAAGYAGSAASIAEAAAPAAAVAAGARGG
jgi:hypothetical protein